VSLVIGSGGVLRNGRSGVEERVFAGSLGAHIDGGWQLPRSARVVVDHDYVLAAAGLLVGEHPQAAHALVRRLAEPLARP
jgi:MutL protein